MRIQSFSGGLATSVVSTEALVRAAKRTRRVPVVHTTRSQTIPVFIEAMETETAADSQPEAHDAIIG